MSTEQNKALMQRFLEASVAGDDAAFKGMMASDFVAHIPSGPANREMFVQHNNVFSAAFSDKSFTAEDLIVLKMLAAREDDLRDVRGILRVQRDRLDLESVRRQLETCCGPRQVSAFESIVADSGGV